MSSRRAAWFGTFLCVLVLALSLMREARESGVAYLPFFAFFPVVLFAMARNDQSGGGK